ncbi:ATP-binding protein [Streptomyces kanasensis]|uniref:ATP-binding protein n=1 Tax=Streptomyces kanasensis TaxID=936756 RepID=UPI0037FFE55F
MSHNATQPLSQQGVFTVQPHPSRAGARLARDLAAVWLRGGAATRPVADDALQVVAELAANAAVHGRVPGRAFLLTLRLTSAGSVLRIETTDTRCDRLPTPQAPTADGESGRGLLIVEALADRWGVTEGPTPRKTVWAELDLTPDRDHARRSAAGQARRRTSPDRTP